MKSNRLPLGQRVLGSFPRYGLYQFANRIVPDAQLRLQISMQDGKCIVLGKDDLADLPHMAQTSDFHCVTTWSALDIDWAGYRFRDFYERIVIPHLAPEPDVRYAVFRGADGYRTYLHLEDLLADTVLLVDQLHGKSLNWEHGGPLRLIAPAHYGYKSAKHLASIEFRTDLKGYRPVALHWHEHPRARVALEERGRFIPIWLQRALNRIIIPTVLFWYKRAKKNAAQEGKI